MNIADLLSEKAISVDIQDSKKDDVLSSLVDLLVASGGIKSNEKTSILEKLKEREALGSTGIGKGIGIPHAKTSKVKKLMAAFGVSREGVDFKSLDGELTHIFFLLIAPGETPGPHLKALAKISRLLDDKFVRERLRNAKNSKEVLKIIKEEEQKKA